MNQQTVNTKKQHDIVIVGGGTVGCTLALALIQLFEQASLTQLPSIAIVESYEYQENQAHPGFDGRAIALARQSLDFLYQLGLQQKIDAITESIQHIHVSDQGHLGQCELDAKSLHVPALGRVIELHDFGRILHSALQSESAKRYITWYCPDQIKALNIQAGEVQLNLDSGAHISTGLLLATDGGESGTRKLLNIEPETRDYHQVALITNIRTSQPHQNRAFERFTQHGPLAFLPMTDNRCSVVWTLTEGDEKALLEASEPNFIQRLQAEFGYRLGEIVQIGQRSVYPLRLSRCLGEHLHRAALLGNAAQTLHPIAGQGFNLGIRDVQDLVLCLGKAIKDPHCINESQATKAGIDFGAYSVLSEFRRVRKQDADTTIGATHGLVQLFSNRDVPLVIARNLGLAGLQCMSPMKARFAQRAMGKRATSPVREA